MHSGAVAFPEDWTGAARVNTHHFLHMGSAQLPVQSCNVSTPLDLWQGVQGKLAQRPLVHLWSYAVGRGPAGQVPAQSGDSHPPLPELPLPMAGIAHQLTGLTGKEQKWMRD